MRRVVLGLSLVLVLVFCTALANRPEPKASKIRSLSGLVEGQYTDGPKFDESGE